jgi:Ca2+-transporting ATPase
MRRMAQTTPVIGLSTAEALARQRQWGANALSDPDHRGGWRTVIGVFTEPMFLFLLVAAAIYLVIGDLGEGLLLACFALATVALVVLQERRSERALEALRSLAQPTVRVLRDGQLQRIDARALVPGDVFLLGEGERIAADGVLCEAAGLAVDESLLTGESVPVRKCIAMDLAVPDSAGPGGEDRPFVYAGTLATSGHGIAQVLAIGRQTRVGRIGASLATIDTAPTPLALRLHRLVRVFALGALGVSLLLVGWWGWQRGDWLQGVLAGIALGMAMLPEEFPMALAVFLALGAWRMAAIQVLARRPAVIEALGAATVLCVDKTGTLTENRMQLRWLQSDDAQADLALQPMPSPTLRALLDGAVLASRRDSSDPMDRAILARAGGLPPRADWRPVREYPLGPGLLAFTQAWPTDEGGFTLATKGAPEAIAGLCGLDEAAIQALLRRVQRWAGQGLRVLAVAHSAQACAVLPERVSDHRFVLLGLLAFEDPLRPSVPAAVARARGAGIAVAMITGDHAATALAIARQAGLDTSAGVLTGAEIDRLDAAALAAAVGGVRVFARVMPEQKLRLVQAFQARGDVVAMTGDGVNDAPALKAAHIGIAMGQRGTDVAREAAALVLLDDDFGRIVDGVRLGRRIFDNLRKVMTYITAIHVPIAGLALLPVLFGWPPLMLPAHVVLTEMVVDPACSLAFEGAPEEAGVMQRPPRRADDKILGAAMLVRGLLQGGALLAATLAIYAIGLRQALPVDQARTLALVGLTVGNLLLAWLNACAGLPWRRRFGSGLGPFWWVAASACSVLALALAWPALRQLLHFGVPPALALLAACAGTVLAVALAAGIARAPRPPAFLNPA